MFVGIKDVSFAQGMRQLLQGIIPTGPNPTKTDVPDELQFVSASGQIGSGLDIGGSTGTALGTRIATAAQKYTGVPYKWGGASPKGWDCSGFVTYVLHHDCGLNLPSNAHTTSGGFLVWKGATTIPRTQCDAGDLLCWPGHVGIALDNKQMINAPTFGIPTRVQAIWGAPVVRRVQPQGGGSVSTPVMQGPGLNSDRPRQQGPGLG